MIVSLVFGLVLTILNFITYVLFAPVRILFPNVISFGGDVTGIITFVSDIFNSTFNFFAYFSHISSVRILFFSAVFYIFTFPIIYSSFALGKFVMDFIIKLPQFIASFKGLFK